MDRATRTQLRSRIAEKCGALIGSLLVKMRTTRGVITCTLAAVTGAAIAVAALTTDSIHDVALNVVAEAFGVGVLSYVVDLLISKDRKRRLALQQRAALEDLRFVLIEIQQWLGRLYLESSSPIAWYSPEENRDEIPVETLIDYLPSYLGKIDFAGPGSSRRDKYFIEWARRGFGMIVDEFERWERNFAGAAGLFDDDFRSGTESLHSFIRAAGSFLEGMERFVLREPPPGPVLAYDADDPITELRDEKMTSRLVDKLHAFLEFYRRECERYEAEVPNLRFILRMN